MQTSQAGTQVVTVAPAVKEGKAVTYCSGLSGFPEERLGELHQTRCAPQLFHRGCLTLHMRSVQSLCGQI